MGDGDDGAGVLGEVLLQPLHGLGVQVVGGLVEQQQVGRLEQQLAERDAALLATGEGGDRPVAGRAAQGVHGLLQLGVQVPRVGVVEVLLELAHLVEQRVGVVGRHQLGDLVEPVELALDLGDAVLRRSPGRSWTRRAAAPAAACRRCSPGDRNASPLDGCSSPAMIFSTVDLPAPFGPTTPIFAPGRKLSVTSSRITLSPCALRVLRMV